MPLKSVPKGTAGEVLFPGKRCQAAACCRAGNFPAGQTGRKKSLAFHRRRISGLREVDRDTGLSQLGVNEKALEQHLRGIPAKEACSHNFKRLFRVS